MFKCLVTAALASALLLGGPTAVIAQDDGAPSSDSPAMSDNDIVSDDAGDPANSADQTDTAAGIGTSSRTDSPPEWRTCTGGNGEQVKCPFQRMNQSGLPR